MSTTTVRNPEPSRPATCPKCGLLPEFHLSWVTDPALNYHPLQVRAACRCGTYAFTLVSEHPVSGRLVTPAVGDLLVALEKARDFGSPEAIPAPTPVPAPASTPGATEPSIDDRLDALLDWYNDRLASIGVAQTKQAERMGRFEEAITLIADRVDDVGADLDADALEARICTLESGMKAFPQDLQMGLEKAQAKQVERTRQLEMALRTMTDHMYDMGADISKKDLELDALDARIQSLESSMHGVQVALNDFFKAPGTPVKSAMEHDAGWLNPQTGPTQGRNESPEPLRNRVRRCYEMLMSACQGQNG